MASGGDDFNTGDVNTMRLLRSARPCDVKSCAQAFTVEDLVGNKYLARPASDDLTSKQTEGRSSVNDNCESYVPVILTFDINPYSHQGHTHNMILNR